MKPIKLHLNNFGSHVDSIIDFDQNSLIGITGYWENDLDKSNGSGKSTFVDAILYAIYGKSRASGTGDNVERLVRDGQTEMFVDFEFEHNSQKIRIKKETKIKGKTIDNKFFVWVNGVLEAEKQTEGKRIISELFNVDYDVFLSTSFFAQGEAGRFMNASSTEKKEYLRKIDNLEIWERAEKVAKDKIKESKNSVAQIEGKLEMIEGKEELEAFINQTTTELSGRGLKLDFNKNSLIQKKKLQEGFLKEKEKIAQANFLKSQIEEFDDSQLAIIDKKIKTLSSSSLGNIYFDKDKFHKLSLEKMQNESDYNAQETALNNWNKNEKPKLERLQGRLNSMPTPDGEWVDGIAQKIDEISLELMDKSAKFQAYKANTAIIERYVGEMTDILSTDVCSGCGQQISQQKKQEQVDKIQKTVKELSSGKEYGTEVQILISEKDKLMKISENNGLIQLRKDLESQIKDISPMPIEDVKLKNKFLNILKEYQEMDKDRIIYEENKSKIDDIQNQIRLLTDEKFAIEQKILAREKINQKIKELDIDLNKIDYSGQIENLEYEISELTLAADRLQNERLLAVGKLNQIVELNSEREKLQEDLVILNRVADGFGKNGIPHLIIQNTLNNIQDRSNDLLSELSNDMSIEFITEKENKSGKLSEVIEVLVNYKGSQRDYNLLSGGEKCVVNFCVRLAISLHISNQSQNAIETVILDEVFSEVDKSGEEKIFSMLNLLKDKFDKILVISHSSMKDIFPSLITFRRNEGGSYVA